MIFQKLFKQGADGRPLCVPHAPAFCLRPFRLFNGSPEVLDKQPIRDIQFLETNSAYLFSSLHHVYSDWPCHRLELNYFHSAKVDLNLSKFWPYLQFGLCLIYYGLFVLIIRTVDQGSQDFCTRSVRLCLLSAPETRAGSYFRSVDRVTVCP